jgi:dTDP-4-amino-4,6-dideoxygalactose transaminase
MIGRFGDAEVFSFHATKFVNGFEGGAVVTDDEDLAHRVRLMKNFGFSGYDNVVSSGTNGKMTEVCAAMTITSLESLEEFVAVNRRHYEHYRRELGGTPGIRLLEYDEGERQNYQYVVLDIEDAALGLTRDGVVEALHAENVLARRYFHPGCHRMAPYRSTQPDAGRRLPVTERMTGRLLTLPTGTAVDDGAIATICDVIRTIAAHAAEVRWRLARGRLSAVASVGAPAADVLIASR